MSELIVREFEINKQTFLASLQTSRYITEIKTGYECYKRLIGQFERVCDVAVLLDAFDKNKQNVIAGYRKASERKTFYISISPSGLGCKNGYINANASKKIARFQNISDIKSELLKQYKAADILRDCEILISTKTHVYIFDRYDLVKDAENNADVFKQIIDCIVLH